MGAGPGPRFRFGDVVVASRLADHENLAVGAMLGVDVGFIPCAIRFKTLHRRVIRLDDGGRELFALMVLELSTDQFDEIGFVSKTEAGRVDRDESTTFLNKAREVFKLVRFDGVVVGVEEDAVELA